MYSIVPDVSGFSGDEAEESGYWLPGNHRSELLSPDGVRVTVCSGSIAQQKVRTCDIFFMHHILNIFGVGGKQNING